MIRTLLELAFVSLATCFVAQQPGTSPANETRSPDDVRSVNSIGPDLLVPLCPQHFHDSLARSGIAAPGERGVTPARIRTAVPAHMTEQAIAAAGKTHIGDFTVILNAIVDAKGLPHEVCLRKSSGYGLDASAAAAVEQYRFAPATKNGKSVESRLQVEVHIRTPFPPPIGTPRFRKPTS